MIRKNAMKTYHFKNIPAGVLLIAAFYMFGALVVLFSIFTDRVLTRQTIAAAHGLGPMIGVEILIAVAALALVLAYGLIHLARWGFVLAIAYCLYLVAVSLAMGGLSFLSTGDVKLQLYFGNFVWSVLVIMYLFLARRHFFKKQASDQRGDYIE